MKVVRNISQWTYNKSVTEDENRGNDDNNNNDNNDKNNSNT